MERIASPARREALLRLGALYGLALTGDVLAAVAKKPGKPELLAADELALTAVLADLIIPRTDTPGARDVDAHRTIDHLLAICTPVPAQAAFRAGLARIGTVDGKRFVTLPPARQVALLHAIDTGTAPFTGADVGWFRQFKSYVAFAYYTSEPGATRELAYLPFPGGFDGHVKLTPSTHAWAL